MNITCRWLVGVCVLLFFCMEPSRAAPPKWVFLPTDKEPRPELAQLGADFDRKEWREVTFPHSFDSSLPEHDVFGWYLCAVDVPIELKGHDLILDLGVIDDADVTYFNGVKIGGMGSVSNANMSASNLDRRYRVPAKLVKYGETNVVAVQVKEFGGNGGMMGQPVLAAMLSAKPNNWRFQEGAGDTNWPATEFDDSQWKKVAIPDMGLKQRVPTNEAHAWYRLKFVASTNWLGKPCVLDLGPIYDAGEVYLNGEPIGSIGSLPPRFVPAASARVRVLVRPGALLATNCLAVHVYWQLSAVPKDVARQPKFDSTRARGGAGLPGYPALDFTVPATAEDAEREGAAAALDFAELSLRDGDLATASEVLARVKSNQLQPEEETRSLDLAIRLACAQSDTNEVKKLFRAFVVDHPAASLSLPTTYAVYALLDRAALSDTVQYVGEDRQTTGVWRGLYGRDGYILCAWNNSMDLTYPEWPGESYSKKQPDASKYAVRILPTNDYARSWVGAEQTQDPRVLGFVGTNAVLYRRYACWNDHGEVHPFDEHGPDLLVDLKIPEGEHFLSFYFLDYDWYNSEHPRIQSVLLMDGKTREPLALAPTGRFGEGVYERFRVQGPRDLCAKIVKHRSSCAVVSGVFLDKTQQDPGRKGWWSDKPLISLFSPESPHVASPKWVFLPTGKEPRPELAQLGADFDRKEWREVTFPHSIDSTLPDDNVFGWYLCAVDVPIELKTHDLVLDLGVIDDADVTYFNGVKIGGMGSVSNANVSAWNIDRRYLIPAKLVKYGETNVVAVQVKEFGGNGGMMGQPVLAAMLSAKPNNWLFQEGAGDTNWPAAEFDDSQWKKVAIPDMGLKQRVPTNEAHAWYRLKFVASTNWLGKPCVLDLGSIYDAGEVYLNGEPIGSIGSLPPRFVPSASARARVLARPGALLATNCLAVHVYWQLSVVPKDVARQPDFDATRARGGAGLPGYPALDFTVPATPEDAERQGVAASLDFAELSLRGGDLETASGVVARVKSNQLQPEDETHSLDLAIRLACTQNDTNEVKKLYRAFVVDHPAASLSLPTTYAVFSLLDRTALSDTVQYVGEDRQTAGVWRGLYGRDGYILCAWNYSMDLTYPMWPGEPFSKKQPDASKYAVRILSTNDYARSWVGVNRTQDPRVLGIGGKGSDLFRRYACWDDHGEVHPFDERGPDLLVDLKIPEGDYFLSFYFLDYDWYNGEHPRIQSVLLMDGKTREPLALAPTGRFGEGVYERFRVQGPRDLCVRIVKHWSPCAVVSGVFLDKTQQDPGRRGWWSDNPHVSKGLPTQAPKVKFQKVENMEVSCPNADNSPQFFEGGKTNFGDPCSDALIKGQSLIVFFDSVRSVDPATSNEAVRDFDVTLKPHVLPTDFNPDRLHVWWEQTSGGNSGSLSKRDYSDVKFQNPKKGGLYKFELDTGIFGQPKSGANLLLPLAGAESSDFVQTEYARIRRWVDNQSPRMPINDRLLAMILLRRASSISARMDYTHFRWVGRNSPCRRFSFDGEETLTVEGVVMSSPKLANMMWGVMCGRFADQDWFTRLGPDVQARLDANPLAGDTTAAQNSYKLGRELAEKGIGALQGKMREYRELIRDPGAVETKLFPSEDSLESPPSLPKLP